MKHSGLNQLKYHQQDRQQNSKEAILIWFERNVSTLLHTQQEKVVSQPMNADKKWESL